MCINLISVKASSYKDTDQNPAWRQYLGSCNKHTPTQTHTLAQTHARIHTCTHMHTPKITGEFLGLKKVPKGFKRKKVINNK